MYLCRPLVVAITTASVLGRDGIAAGVVLHRERPVGDGAGAGAQITWARIAPNRLNELLDAYRHNLMPRLQDLMGFDSLSMLVDRRPGRTVSVTAFESRDALALVRTHARHLREQFA